MGKWQRRAILADLYDLKHPAVANQKLLKFIVNSIIRLVSGATPLDPLNNRVESIQQYDISTDAMCMDIIRCHNKYLVAAKHAKQTKDDLVNDLVKKAAEDTAAKQQGSGKKTRQTGTKGTKATATTATTAHAIDTYGVMYTEHIQDNVHLYVAYGIWMQRRTQMLERILFDAREKQIKDVETTMQFVNRQKEKTTQGTVSSHRPANVESAFHEFRRGTNHRVHQNAKR
jgi:hypothetical protein